MLTISKPLSSGQAQTYHAKEFTSAEQNYWKLGDAFLENGKVGWQCSLGLPEPSTRSISPDSRRAASPYRGATGAPSHRRRHTQRQMETTVAPVEHRAGWDATFSAPKSVSLTALVGGDDRVREAHRQP